jgi:hypothetical protein
LQNAEHELLLIPLPIRPGIKGQLYDVIFEGAPIVRSTLDPEHNAARALLKLGKTGFAVTRRIPGGTIGMRINIELAAKYALHETSRQGFRLAPYRKFEPQRMPKEVFELAS